MKGISTGICTVAEYDNSVFYKAQCSCMSEKHEQTLLLAYEEDIDQIQLTIYSTIWTNYVHTYDDNWWERLCTSWKSQVNKWKKVWTLITTGQIEGENDFLFSSEEQVGDYIRALQLGVIKMTESREAYKSKKVQEVLSNLDS